MKNFKKWAGILLVLVMIFSLIATACALAEPVADPETTDPSAGSGSEETVLVKLFGSDSHQYELYQIFTGSVDSSHDVLSDVKWGVNGTGTTGDPVPSDVLERLEGLSEAADEVDKLDVIKDYVDFDGTSPVATIPKTGVTEVRVAPGYYIIKDVTSSRLPAGDALSAYIAEIFPSEEMDGVPIYTINGKINETTSQKKVRDINDSTGESSKGTDIYGLDTPWVDSADYDIGDSVPFRLEATLGTVVNYANGYALTFHDKQDSGFDTPAEGDFHVYVDDVEIPATVMVDGKAHTNYEIQTSLTDGCSFHVHFDDVRDLYYVDKDSNKTQPVGINVYEVIVDYAATLNGSAKIGETGNENVSHVTYSNDPYADEPNEEGYTVDDIVTVFTYKVVVDKICLNPHYDADKDADGDEVDDAGEAKYIPLQNADFTLYKYDKEQNEYLEVRETINGTSLKETTSEGTTFSWKGLDDGQYKLVETTTPDGYNTAEALEFTITADHVLDGSKEALGLTELKTDIDVFKWEQEDTGDPLVTQVENVSGTRLPTTGGMGTTILYAGGGILVLAAIVLLIAKRRASAEK